MNTKTAFLLLVLATLIGCNTGPSVVLKDGYYQLKSSTKKTPGYSTSESRPNFTSAVLHVKSADSLEFPGLQNIGDALWGHSRFSYQIKGDQITLSDKDFSQRMGFGYAPDSLIWFDLNAGDTRTVFFERLTLQMKGKTYKVVGFELAKGNENTNVSEYIATLFTKTAFSFGAGDSVVIAPALARYLTKDAQLSDSIFTCQIGENDITFSQASHSLKISYVFDGVFRLHLDDQVFKRLDLMEEKQPATN